VAATPGDPTAADHPVFNPAIDPYAAPATAAGTRGASLTPREQADHILASLLAGSGPIVLGVAGTIGNAWEHAVLTTARSIMAQWHGAISFASIPYHNGVFDNVKRFFGAESDPDQNVLAMVIDGLRRNAPGRPILIVSESQGSWMVAKTLEDPVLAGAVTRAMLFSTPGFQRQPTGVGQAAAGAATLPGPTGVATIEHVDDIVPSLFSRLGGAVLHGYVQAFSGWLHTHDFQYVPHHYEAHGDAAAAWLLRGERPSSPRHPSGDDPAPPPVATSLAG
jgi:hypothetical protein